MFLIPTPYYNQQLKYSMKKIIEIISYGTIVLTKIRNYFYCHTTFQLINCKHGPL